MTYEEAIKHFKSLQKRYTKEHNGRMCEKVNLAIEALEKQIPKKVKKYNLKFYTCLNCGNGYGGFFDMLHFCWNCGQR